MTAFSAYLGLALALAPQGKAPNAPRVAPYDSAWTREAWTADEAPYLAVRREVEAYVLGRRVSQTRTDLVGQTERMVASLRADPKNPVVLYRAAYYAWYLAGLDYSPEARALLRASPLAMGAIPSPRSREYDRLRMLREGFLNGVFLDLGERLYKLDPDDVELALKLCETHTRYGPGSRERAVEIATRLLKTGDPKRYPAIYFAYGEGHGATYMQQHTIEDARQAMWGYRQYLAAGSSWKHKAALAKEHLDGFETYFKEHGQPVPTG